MAIYIKESKGKDRGVFTDADIEVGELIEICPVIVLPAPDRELIDQTEIFNYYFLWDDDHSKSALALGYGSLYNHSNRANTIYESYYEEREIHFICHRPIKAGEEITINYNLDPDCEEKMWFE
jgi:SET domain-containing protein